MEGVMKQWEEAEAEAEVEDVALLRRQAHVHVTTTITARSDTQAPQHNGVSGLKNAGIEFSQTEATSSDIEEKITSTDIAGIEFYQTEVTSSDIEDEITLHPSDPVVSMDLTSLNTAVKEFSQKEATSSDIEEKITLHPPEPVISVVSASPINATTVSQRGGIITENVGELYLERVYQKLPTQGFYCPTCKACIQKVLIQDTVVKGPSRDKSRCPSCFSFLIPIGSWLGLVKDSEGSTGEEEPRDESPKPAPKKKVPPPDQVKRQADAGKLVTTDEAPKASIEEDHKTKDSSNQYSEIPRDEQGQDELRSKRSRWRRIAGVSALAALKKPKVHVSEPSEQPSPLEEIKVDDKSTELPATTMEDATAQASAVQEPESTKTFEILKSIVYGGLIEYITSLSIVTSAASADASTLSILALSLANLIGGFFVLVHHIWDLKSEQQSTNNQTNALVDRYCQLLGKRENFFLHLPIAILSFLIFGLVPPLVYAFAFYGSNDMDLKLAAVAGASVLCITLLSIAKAYIQRPTKYQTYLKTVLYYLTTGALASVVAYLAGELIRKLLEKLGWFDSASSSFTLLLPEMTMEKPRFGSY